MSQNEEYELRKGLAKAVQKALISHNVNPEKIGDTMTFLGLVLGGMIGEIFPPERQKNAVDTVVDGIKTGIEKGLPKTD